MRNSVTAWVTKINTASMNTSTDWNLLQISFLRSIKKRPSIRNINVMIRKAIKPPSKNCSNGKKRNQEYTEEEGWGRSCPSWREGKGKQAQGRPTSKLLEESNIEESQLRSLKSKQWTIRKRRKSQKMPLKVKEEKSIRKRENPKVKPKNCAVHIYSCEILVSWSFFLSVYLLTYSRPSKISRLSGGNTQVGWHQTGFWDKIRTIIAYCWIWKHTSSELVQPLIESAKINYQFLTNLLDRLKEFDIVVLLCVWVNTH